MNSAEGITQEERNILNQFAEITNYDSENEEENAKIMRLLTVCNWNLETAIARYFDNDFPQLFNDPAMSIPNQTEILEANLNDVQNIGLSAPFNDSPVNLMAMFPNDTFFPKLQRALPISNKWKFQAGLISSQSSMKTYSVLTPIVFILMIIPNILLFVGYGLNKLLGNFAPNLFRILGLREDENDFPNAPVYISKEENEQYSIEKIMSIHDDEKLPPVWEGDFNTAFEEAKNNHKWLSIVLFNSQISSAQQIIEFVKSEKFVSFIKKNNIILYIGDVSYSEPFEVGKTYQAYGLPYLALIGNISIDGVRAPEFSIACRYLHLLSQSTDRVLKRLNRVVTMFEPQLVSQRYDKQERELAKFIREEQDNAYQESLLRDMKRANEKKQKLEEKKRIQEDLEREKEEIELTRIKRKEKIIRYINEKYVRDISSWVKGEYTTIQFRTDDGQRFIRKFHQDETVADIYYFVTSKQFLNELVEDDAEAETEEQMLTKLKTYNFLFDNDTDASLAFFFELVSPMPRLRLQPSNTSIKDIKTLWPNGSLLIEKVYDEDEDKEDIYSE